MLWKAGIIVLAAFLVVVCLCLFVRLSVQKLRKLPISNRSSNKCYGEPWKRFTDI